LEGKGSVALCPPLRAPSALRADRQSVHPPTCLPWSMGIGRRRRRWQVSGGVRGDRSEEQRTCRRTWRINREGGGGELATGKGERQQPVPGSPMDREGGRGRGGVTHHLQHHRQTPSATAALWSGRLRPGGRRTAVGRGIGVLGHDEGAPAAGDFLSLLLLPFLMSLLPLLLWLAMAVAVSQWICLCIPPPLPPLSECVRAYKQRSCA
jgi:hypothetical protein